MQDGEGHEARDLDEGGAPLDAPGESVPVAERLEESAHVSDVPTGAMSWLRVGRVFCQDMGGLGGGDRTGVCDVDQDRQERCVTAAAGLHGDVINVCCCHMT